MYSLADIEKTVSLLWLNEASRQWLSSGREGEPPPCMSGSCLPVVDEVDCKGVELYGRMMSFGHQDVMASVFPFCRLVLGKQWEDLLDDYMLHCPPDHYNFNRLCSRFSQYLTIYGGTACRKYPFLSELADFEWQELEKLEMDVSITPVRHIPLTSPELVARLSPVVNPSVTVTCYLHNIPALARHLETKGKLPRKIQSAKTWVVTYREPESHSYRFLVAGEKAARLIAAASQGPISYQELLAGALDLTGRLNPIDSVTEFLDIIERLQESRVFVGSIDKCAMGKTEPAEATGQSAPRAQESFC